MSSSAKVQVGEAGVPVTAEPVVLMKHNRFPYFLQENTHSNLQMGNIENLYFHAAKTMQPTPVVLLGKSHGWGPGRLQSMGSGRVEHD